MKPRFHLNYIFFLIFITYFPSSISGNPLTQLLDRLFENYDKRILPNPGVPLKVNVNAYILGFHAISEKTHDFTVQLYLRQAWADPRLSFRPVSNIRTIALDEEMGNKIWAPDTFFENEVSSVYHSTKNLNEFTRISPNGQILRSSKYTVTATCPMNLKMYPFDTQTCTLEIESYGYKADELYYEWKGGEEGIGISDEVAREAKFSIQSYKTKQKLISLQTGNYSRFSIEFQFRRLSTRYVQTVYLPVIILTVGSLLTLFAGSPISRITNTILIMIGFFAFTAIKYGDLPEVAYNTYLDSYICICTIFILVTLVVNTILFKFEELHLQTKVYKTIFIEFIRLTFSHLGQKSRIADENEINRRGGGGGSDGCYGKCSAKMAFFFRILVLVAKVVIVTLFIIYNLFYWIGIFLSEHGVSDDDDSDIFIEESFSD